jgi:hypothetical protein
LESLTSLTFAPRRRTFATLDAAHRQGGNRKWIFSRRAEATTWSDIRLGLLALSLSLLAVPPW